MKYFGERIYIDELNERLTYAEISNRFTNGEVLPSTIRSRYGKGHRTLNKLLYDGKLDDSDRSRLSESPMPITLFKKVCY